MPSKKSSPKDKIYDMIIIGSGCVGYGAAMYAGRLEMKTLVLGDIDGGTLILTDLVENWPGIIRCTGKELTDKLKEHALDYKEFVELKDGKVTKIEKHGDCFNIETDSAEKFVTKTVLLATGAKHRELTVKGGKEFENKGVHYCALCDGPLYSGTNMAVIGGSDSAAKEAIALARYAKKVYIIYRGDEIHPEPPNMARIEDLIRKGKIEIINNVNVTEVKGDKAVKSVVLDKEYKGKKELAVDAVFVAIGLIPLSDLAKQVGVELNEKKEVKINRKSETNVAGFYAAGDVTDTTFKQAITGVSEGVTAAFIASGYVNDNVLKCEYGFENNNGKKKKAATE